MFFRKSRLGILGLAAEEDILLYPVFALDRDENHSAGGLQAALQQLERFCDLRSSQTRSGYHCYQNVPYPALKPGFVVALKSIMTS